MKNDHDINCARMLSPDPTAPCTCKETYWQNRFVAVENKYNLLRQRLTKFIAENKEWGFARHLQALLDQEAADIVKPAETLESLRQRWEWQGTMRNGAAGSAAGGATTSQSLYPEFDLVVAIARAVVKGG